MHLRTVNGGTYCAHDVQDSPLRLFPSTVQLVASSEDSRAKHSLSSELPIVSSKQSSSSTSPEAMRSAKRSRYKVSQASRDSNREKQSHESMARQMAEA